MPVDELNKLFSSHREVEELRVPALLNLDTENLLVLPSPKTAYLGREGAYLRFAVHGESGQFRIDAVPEVVLEQYPDEPDVRVVELDLTAFHLGDTVPMRISEATLYRSTRPDPRTGLWRAALIGFESGWSLLLDPSWPEGIKFGSQSDLRWLEGEAERLEPLRFA